jgi:predicted GTPase
LLQPFDILLVGATGAGKSTTLNALFDKKVAEIGSGVEPQTQNISSYPLSKYLRFHDSPGFGDGGVADIRHDKHVEKFLHKKVPWQSYLFVESYLFVDMVLVILEGNSRDMGTPLRLLENTILKNIEPDRVVVAINQADLAMKNHGWDVLNNQPKSDLLEHLEEKARSVKRRIFESTRLCIEQPTCYSAKYHWNIKGLLEHIVRCLPKERRKFPGKARGTQRG